MQNTYIKVRRAMGDVWWGAVERSWGLVEGAPRAAIPLCIFLGAWSTLGMGKQQSYVARTVQGTHRSQTACSRGDLCSPIRRYTINLIASRVRKLLNGYLSRYKFWSFKSAYTLFSASRPFFQIQPCLTVVKSLLFFQKMDSVELLDAGPMRCTSQPVTHITALPSSF